MVELWRISIETGRLALEAQQVIALRMLRIASGGPRAASEVRRMVAEKATALLAAQTAAARGPPDSDARSERPDPRFHRGAPFPQCNQEPPRRVGVAFTG